MERVISERFYYAYETDCILTFCNIMMGPSWSGIVARIMENGAQFNKHNKIDWLPGWSSISMTKKISKTNDSDEAIFKSLVYRFHDIIHNIWVFPNLKITSPKDEFLYKKIQMAGEVATLTITEFFWLSNLHREVPYKWKVFIEKRNAHKIYGVPIKEEIIYDVGDYVSLMVGEGSIKGAFSGTASEDFASDYFRMLEEDRSMIDENLSLIKMNNWSPSANKFYIPSRYDYDISEKKLVRSMLRNFMKYFENKRTSFNNSLRFSNLNRRYAMNPFPSGWRS